MYQCNCCGHRFEQPQAYVEPRGEFWGVPAWERMMGCPHCGGSYQQIKQHINEGRRD